jgi:hypothetical protein
LTFVYRMGQVIENGGYLLKSSICIAYMAVCCFGLIFFVIQPAAYAQENAGESIDCTDVTVDYEDDLTLSREERLRLMDEAFFQSLNKFEQCQSAKKMAETGGVAGGGGKGTEGGSGDTTGETETASTGESVASSAMSGTETQAEPPPAGGVEAGKSGTLQRSQDRDKAHKTGRGKIAHSNGKPPEDIPSAENDDVLAAQIRYAAEKETDPVKKKRLWNEYRKYKGLEPEK